MNSVYPGRGIILKKTGSFLNHEIILTLSMNGNARELRK